MRRRRAQRCLLRAQVALDAGSVDDARSALEEAQTLHAPPEEVARVEGLIAAKEAAAADPPKRRMRWAPLAVASVVVIGVSAFGLGTFQRRQAPAPLPAAQAAAPTPPVQPTDDASTTVQNVPVRVADVLAVATTGIAPDSAISSASEAEDDAAETPPEREPEPAVADLGDAATPPRVATPQALPLTSTAALPAASTFVTPPAPPPPPPEAPARATATPAARVAPNFSPVPGLTSGPAPRDESADVRAVLSHYENAYSQLDPSRARAVWPTVDERALARAFSSLASQEVSLGRCDVSVSGATARATCAGTATWTPKVGGGGARTEARRWTFDLRKTGDAWRIERALAR